MGRVTSSGGQTAPNAHVPVSDSLLPQAASGTSRVPGSKIDLGGFGLLRTLNLATLSLQRPFALVRARATGLLKLSCAIDPVRSNERRAVAANGDLCLPCWAFSTFYLLPTGGASQILDITRGSDKAWGFLACQKKGCVEKNSRKA